MTPEVAVLLGVAATGIVTLLNTAMTTWSTANQAKKKESLEALSGIHDSLAAHSSICWKLAAHGMTTVACNKVQDANFDEINSSVLKIKYLLILHAPELVMQFRPIEEATANAAVQWVDLMMGVTRQNIDMSALSRLLDLSNNQREQIRRFQVELAEYARKRYAGDFWFRFRRFLDGNGF